jgi:hypothetical protein
MNEYEYGASGITVTVANQSIWGEGNHFSTNCTEGKHNAFFPIQHNILFIPVIHAFYISKTILYFGHALFMTVDFPNISQKLYISAFMCRENQIHF